MLSLYQKYISPIYHWLGKHLFGDSFGCRFHPTCSVYYQQALQRHGNLKGHFLGIKRILRCNPFFRGGLDPVPAKSRLQPDKIN